jgi:ACT domain-containing protein
MSLCSELNPGDLIKVSDTAYSPISKINVDTVGIFLRHNKKYAWLRYPVCDVYIRGKISQYSRHLIRKI